MIFFPNICIALEILSLSWEGLKAFCAIYVQWILFDFNLDKLAVQNIFYFLLLGQV